MSKEFRIFFSWQSDLAANRTTRLIKECILKAKEILSASVDLIIDQATRDKLGSPDIGITILEKIQESDLFIADVSVVGEYVSPNEKDEDDAESNLFPNPNVLLELGFAAGVLEWERCICLANSDFGDIAKLPFDLNHRRITDISYGKDKISREKRIDGIAKIIAGTVSAYIEEPLPKKDFAHHIIGGYAFDTNEIVRSIIPLNDYTFSKYSIVNRDIETKIHNLINCINNLQITVDLTSEPLLSGQENIDNALQKLLKENPVKIDSDHIKQLIDKYFPTELSKDFFCVGNLTKRPGLIPHQAPKYFGTLEEKDKYDKLCELEHLLLSYHLRILYAHTFDNICIVPIAIKNISNKQDSDISIDIEVMKGTPVQPNADVFNPDIKGCEGFVYEDGLIKEILNLPDNKSIKHGPSAPEITAPIKYVPPTDVWGYRIEPRASEEEYEWELQDYVQETNESADREYSFSVQSIRPNETLWLGNVLLIIPEDGQIQIEYSLKSNNTKGDITGSLSLIE